MKKSGKGQKVLIAMMLLALLTLALPVFAEEGSDSGSDSEDSEDADDDDSSDSDDDSMKVETRERVRLETNDEGMLVRKEVRIKDGKVETRTKERLRAADGSEVRIETRSRTELNAEQRMRLEALKEKRTTVAERLSNLKEMREDRAEFREKVRMDVQVAREQALELKESLRAACADDAESEACVEEKEKVKADYAEILYKSAARLREPLETVKKRVKASDLDEERKVEVSATVDANLEKLASIEAKIEALGDDVSRDELQGIKNEIKELMLSSVTQARSAVHRITRLQVGAVVEKLDVLGERLDARITAQAEAGVDTAEAEELLVEYQAHVEVAKAESKAAQDLLAQNGAGDEEVKEHLKNAKEAVKEAHEVAREIIQWANSVEVSVDVEVEAE